MEKPKPKREVAITNIFKFNNEIWFQASQDSANDLEEFGTIIKRADRKEWYSIRIDSRYDFDEVLKYIENYG
jgi:hypothetical protein